uniref:Copia protein n=1 Tax=Tanacetum cinerariifolium TaxID=118510 RepID=A0A699HFU1_TANCI|nr:copia protein [Tanacetum cinerariifolium]
MASGDNKCDAEDVLSKLLRIADNTKPPLSIDTFGNNGGDDSETSGPVTQAEELVDSGHSSTLSSLVEHGSLRVLQLWGTNAFISYGDGSALLGKVNFKGVRNVTLGRGRQNKGKGEVLRPRAKVTAIEESKDLTSLSLDELIRNLKVYEMIIKKYSKIVKAKGERKSLALKAKKKSSDEKCSTSRSEDEKYAIAVRDFKKFFKKVFKRRDRFVRQFKTTKRSSKVFEMARTTKVIENVLDAAKDETCLIAQASNEICLGADLEPDEWIKDNECSKHMTGNRKLFSSYKAYNGGNVIFGGNLHGNIIGKEPKNVNEALTDKSWLIAIQEELNQFIANDVWDLVPQHKNMTIIGTKWVFRNKLDENGIVSQNKAKLVAQGYNQQEGIDYDETSASVARLESIRIQLVYACALDFKLFQVDVKSAFLDGFINEENQTALAISTTEAEYVSTEKACQQALWMKQAFIDYDVRLDDVLIMCDNKGVIDVSKNLDFQDSPDDEEDTRSSHEYLKDLEEEYQAKSLLAKYKRFFKKAAQRFSSAKATDQIECHKCGKKGHFARDCWSKTSVPSYQSPFQPKLLHSFENKPKMRNTKDFESKYNKEKAKLALLNSNALALSSFPSKNKANNSDMSITSSVLHKLSEAEGSTLPNHNTDKVPSNKSQRNIIDPLAVISDSPASDYDSADESSVCSTPLLLLKKLDGAEPSSRPKTIKLILKSKSTFKAKTLKGITINEPSSAPARDNKSSSASKTNLTPVGNLKNVNVKDDPPIAMVMKELNELKLQISKK